jgi:hypothetical protein
MIDAETGQVLHSHNSSGRASSAGVAFSGSQNGKEFNTDTFKNAPIGKATRQAIEDALKFIVNSMEKLQFTAKIVKCEGKKVYINCGAAMSIIPGVKFLAYSVGEEFTDPDTGIKLGSDEKLLGTVEVTEVQEKFSVGCHHLRRRTAEARRRSEAEIRQRIEQWTKVIAEGAVYGTLGVLIR